MSHSSAGSREGSVLVVARGRGAGPVASSSAATAHTIAQTTSTATATGIWGPGTTMAQLALDRIGIVRSVIA